MRVLHLVAALVLLFAFGNAEAMSIESPAEDFQQVIMPESENDGELVIKPLREDDGELVIKPLREDDGELVIMPKRQDDGELVIVPKHFNWGSVFIKNVTLSLKPGVPVSFAHNFQTINTGTRWLFSGPLGYTLQLICNLAVNASSSCSAGLFQISAGCQSLSYCGLFGKFGWSISAPQASVLGAKCLGGSAGGFNCTIVASATSTSTSTSTSTTTTTTANPGGSPTCRCGRKNPIIRIVGGVETTVHEYPWQVGLVPTNGITPFCGGSIISNQYILTAAHCFNSISPSSVRVVIGEHNTQSTSETTATKYIGIESVTIHSGYNRTTHNNDIALIKLSQPITFPSDNKVAPICLPPAGNTFENVLTTATGWGTTSQAGSLSNTLREVDITTLTNTRCRELLGANFNPTTMLCAGPEAGGKDTCQGDSGGPLTTSGGTKYQVLAGITSWGYGCAQPLRPGVYTRVNNYLPWITSNIAGSLTCPPP